MLRLRVPLLPGESATSFCSRLAHRNRCSSVGEFCRDMGFAFRDVITGTDEALLQLANLGGADIEQLRSCALRFDGFDYACGSNLIEPALRRSMDQLMVCPACIAADLSRWGDVGVAAPAGRTAWLLTPVSTCIEHQVALVATDIRPKNAHWRTAEFHDFASRIQPFLREIEHQLDTAERRAPTELECYLHARLSATKPAISELVDALPFYAVPQASLVVGTFLRFGPRAGLKHLSEDQRREVEVTGFDVLSAGQDALRAALRAGMERWPKGKNAAGANAFFGTLHTWLLYRKGDSAYEFLRNAIREVMVSATAMRANEPIYGIIPGNERLQSVLTASEETGMHPKRLQRLLVATGVLNADAAHLSAHKATFPANDRTSSILARILRCLPKGAAGKYVNTPRIQFDLLHKAGIVTPFIKAGGVLKDHGFDKHDLDIFLERLIARARSSIPENVDVTQIPTAAKRASCSTVTVVRMILDGILDRIYRQADIAGFMSILVDPKEIQAALLKPERTGLSIRQVEARMRWTRNVICGLTRNGRLPAGSARNPVTKRIQMIIEPKDLDEFDTKYVSLSALSKEKRLFPGTVRAWLGGLGIEPAFDPKAVGATFYRRAELPTA